MKSLMRIYFNYIVTALVIIFMFVLLQFVLLAVITSKVYDNDSGGKRYSIARVYEVVDEDGQEAAACLQEMGASFASVPSMALI